VRNHPTPYAGTAAGRQVSIDPTTHRRLTGRRASVRGVPNLDGAARRARLADARLYLCTDARRDRGDLAEFADAALAGGVDILQLRDKADGRTPLEARDELAALEVLAAACERHGALLAVNDRADVALAAGADVLHLGQDDLPVTWARRVLGDEVLIGRSTHAVAEARAAAVEPGVDYFCTGPTWPTPTKPGRPAPGLDLVRDTASTGTDRAWFAIGGIDRPERLEQVLDAGASRVVVVRVITEAEDPRAAARALADRLADRAGAAAGPRR
jgi:thiamine-phosphate pyrophosphorylase